MNGINRALEYIEENLHNEISISEVAQLAYMSTFAFQRMFTFIAGVPVSEYIRRRRLTQAALILLRDKTKVIDVALMCGYTSPDSFARAFQAMHSTTPSAAKNGNIALTAYPRLSFSIQAKGVKEMKYRIEKKPAFSVVGYRCKFSDHDEGAKEIPTICEEWKISGKLSELCHLPMKPPYGIHGVNNPLEGNAFEYYLAIVSDIEPPIESHAVRLLISEYTWAIFELTGPMPDTMTEGFRRIYSEWFPVSGYTHAGGPELEIYEDSRAVSIQDYKSEIWIPVSLSVTRT